MSALTMPPLWPEAAYRMFLGHTDLGDVHALCRLPDCVCLCHASATALRDTE